MYNTLRNNEIEQVPYSFRPDEGQLSYEDNAFWIEYIKSRLDGVVAGPFFILFTSFGSHSPSLRLLRIKNSASIDVLPNRRVSLLPPIDGVGIGGCFTFDEVKDLCSVFIGNRGFNVDEDVLRHLFTLTNGHPGLTYGLLKCLFERGVNEQILGAEPAI
jgi:hypothetical protein